MEALHGIFKWMHIFAGIIWIGILYFFNFINGPFAKTLDGDGKKKVVPELMPRALYWFRWGAAWTWFTGVFLLLLIFYHSGLHLEDGTWSTAAIILILVPYVAPFIYDTLMKATKASPKAGIIVGFLVISAYVLAMACWGNFNYRGYNIHLGAMFGTIMAFNVWFRIWPAQRKIITAVKTGEAPNADLVALAGSRSRHNTYMSVPLVWTMINQHTTAFAGSSWLPSRYAWVFLLAIVILGWHIVWQCYKKADKVQGF